MADTSTADSAADEAQSTDERLETLYEKWSYFKDLFDEAAATHQEMRKTNLRGNLILIERAIRQLGGNVPGGPGPAAH